MLSEPTVPEPIDLDTVRHIARLSRIALSEQELRTFGEQLADILAYFGKLQELDPSDVDETDQLQAQLGKIVAAQAYIRSQLPRDPGEYEDLP